MSLAGIVSGACAVLTATSAFDDVNLSWMDPGVVDTSPCRWAGMFTLESADPRRVVYGQTTPNVHVWRVTLRTWIKYGVSDFETWQGDHKTLPQDIVDAISGSDTLSGSCTHATVSLAPGPEAVEVGGRRVAEFTWTIEAEEYDR